MSVCTGETSGPRTEPDQGSPGLPGLPSLALPGAQEAASGAPGPPLASSLCSPWAKAASRKGPRAVLAEQGGTSCWPTCTSPARPGQPWETGAEPGAGLRGRARGHSQHQFLPQTPAQPLAGCDRCLRQARVPGEAPPQTVPGGSWAAAEPTPAHQVLRSAFSQRSRLPVTATVRSPDHRGQPGLALCPRRVSSRPEEQALRQPSPSRDSGWRGLGRAGSPASRSDRRPRSWGSRPGPPPVAPTPPLCR